MLIVELDPGSRTGRGARWHVGYTVRSQIRAASSKKLNQTENEKKRVRTEQQRARYLRCQQRRGCHIIAGPAVMVVRKEEKLIVDIPCMQAVTFVTL